MDTVLSISHLTKRYNKEEVLSDLSLALKKGEILGLIGPSGSGKSTLIKLAMGMEKPDLGSSQILGCHMPHRLILGKLGYMAQSDALYQSLTGYENLSFFAQMTGLKKAELAESINQVAAIVDLTAHLGKKVSTYSGGMKRRLSLAISLLGQPDLLILDEPTVGIDPSLRKKIWQALLHLKEQGVTILITTHVMDEAEKADRVALLRAGKIIACDSPNKLKASYQVASLEDVFLKIEGE